MKKKFIILLALLITPLTLGFWVGYRVGHAGESSPSITDPQSGDDLMNARTAIYQPANRDSITDQISSQRQNAITHAIAIASPAVVGINVTEVREYEYQNPWSQFFGDDPFFRQYFGNRTFKQEIKGLGSGFIISEDGYILTNDHVAGNAKLITITMTNGKKYSAELVGTDLVSDIALLKIDGKDLPYLKLGNSDNVIIGEWAIALGNPFGLFEISDKPTVTVGVVSATGMNLRAEGGRYYRGMIQTDAAINSGNSGGPLLNSLGEVMGVNSVIFTPNQGSVGLGFAIPINRVKTIVAELRKKGKIERNFTGLEVQNIDERVVRYFGLQSSEGVIVTDVRRNSPALRAGVRVGDVIIEVNGEKISNEEDITSIVAYAKVGETLRLKIIREGKTILISLTPEKRT